MLTDVVNEALIRSEASKNGAKKLLFSGALINFDNKPISAFFTKEDWWERTQVLNMPFSIKYKPFVKTGENVKYPYIISGAFFKTGNRTRVGSFEDMKKRAERSETDDDKILAWMLENTDICEDYFILAKINFGITFYIHFDMIAYAKKVNPNWDKKTTYLLTIAAAVNEDYNIDRIEGKRARDRMYQEEQRKKRKEAKRCQQ